MMKQVIGIVLFSCVFCYQSLAQVKKNSVQLFTGAMQFTNSNYIVNFSSQWGISYERKIMEKIFFEATYNQWTTSEQSIMPINSAIVYSGNVENRKSSYLFFQGLLNSEIVASRVDFKFLDLISYFQIFANSKHKGKFLVGLGPSYGWGTNYIVDTVYLPTIPPFDYIEAETHTESARYFGITPKVKYTYPFWKKRMCVGSSASCRKLIGVDDLEFNFNLIFGFNF